MVSSHAAIDEANHDDGQSNKRSPPLGFVVEQVLRPVRGIGCEPIWYGSRTRDSQIIGLVLYPLS